MTCPSVLGVQVTQPRGYGRIAEHACTRCRARSEGVRDNKCVRLLWSAHLYTCAAAGTGEAGRAADRRVVQQPVLQPYIR
jgi:hypothetical protein